MYSSPASQADPLHTSETFAATDEAAQVLAARICHDLVSPVGAVVNGIDLLREIGSNNAADEITMIGQSAARAATILEFHRLAFGAAGTLEPEIARPALQRTLEAMLDSTRVAFSVNGTNGPPLTRAVARLAAMMSLAGRGLTGMRGSIGLDLDADGGLPMSVTVTTDDISRRSALVERIRTAPPPEPRTVEFDRLSVLAGTAGARLSVDESPPTLIVLSAAALI